MILALIVIYVIVVYSDYAVNYMNEKQLEIVLIVV